MFTIYATDYAPVDPITPPCDIVPIFIGYRGENKARCLVFDLTECVNTFGDGGFVISFIRQGDELPYLVTDTDRLDNNAIWIITDTDTAVDGYGMVQLQYIVDEVVCKSALYRTVTFESNGITGDVPDPYEDLLAQIAAYASTAQSSAAAAVAAAATATTAVEEGVKTERSQRIAADNGLSARIDSLQASVGAPLTTTQASAMTDVNKIYVYTGSETGYTFGNWYYYNGAEWVSGGVYNSQALETDKTLTVSDMAADAAVVGDRIDECMAAFVTESITDTAIASFDDGADDVPLKDLVVNITPVQAGSGDPSPSNVRAISGYTAANITRTGRNLLKYNIPTYPGLTITENADGSFHVSGQPTNSGSIYLWNNANNPIIVPEGAIFYWGVEPAGNFTIILGTASNTTAVNRSYGTQWTMPSGAYILFRIYVASGKTYDFDFKPIISIDGDGTFEKPTGNNTYNVSFGSAGTVYGGTLDVTSGMLTVTHALVDLGTLNWTKWAYNNSFNTNISTAKTAQATEVCSQYSAISSGRQASLASGQCCFNAGATFYILDSTYADSTAAEFKTAMNGVQLCYELANPTSVQLSATEIRTLLGNNNIWSDTGSVASCEYRADTKLYIEKLTSPDDDMVANANITSGSYFMVGNSLYLATSAIAAGATIIPGTNCTATNLAAALNAINS